MTEYGWDRVSAPTWQSAENLLISRGFFAFVPYAGKRDNEGSDVQQFKVGDRVRLTGPEWGDAFPLPDMNTVTVEDVDQDGILKFVGIEGWWYGDEDEGWGMELNLDTPTEHFKKIAEVAEQLGISSFEQSVRYHTNKVADLLISKNKAYGDSALNPVRIFSKADRMEQLYTRLDDKLSRVQKGHEYPGDDTIQDIIGYCLLILIARESN